MSAAEKALLDSKEQEAREALDAHVREVVRWHFDPATGCPFWLEYARRLGWDPREEVRSFEDLSRLGWFQDDWLRGGPVQRWIPKGLAGKPVFVFETAGLRIAHLGDLSQKLNEQQLKAFGKVDVALTPIGGGRTMGPDLAREVLAQLKPKIAIPMHHRDSPYLIRQFTAGLKTQIMKTDTLAVSKDALPSSLEIRVLQPRGAMTYE